MILHCVDRRVWGQALNVGGKMYDVDDDGFCVIDDSDHAMALLSQSSNVWSKLSETKEDVEPAARPSLLPLSVLPSAGDLAKMEDEDSELDQVEEDKE